MKPLILKGCGTALFTPFKDGKVDEIPSKLWDDYQYVDRMFAVKRRGVWIAVYNMDAVDCIVVG